MRLNLTSKCRIFLLSLIFLSFSQNIQASDNELVNMIEGLHENLLDNMKQAEELSYQGRYEKIAPIIEETFDFPIIAKVILSRYWKQLSDEQKEQFIDSLTDLTIATYASRFNAYSDEQFQTGELEELKKGRKLLKTKIVSADETVNLDYLVHQRNQRWYIISVIANGVNDLSLKRAEYSAVIKERGFTQLIEEISGKISQIDKS